MIKNFLILSATIVSCYAADMVVEGNTMNKRRLSTIEESELELESELESELWLESVVQEERKVDSETYSEDEFASKEKNCWSWFSYESAQDIVHQSRTPEVLNTNEDAVQMISNLIVATGSTHDGAARNADENWWNWFGF